MIVMVEAPRPVPAGPRHRSDLDKGGVTPKTRSRRILLLQAFQSWIEKSVAGYNIDELARDYPVLFAEALVEYGKRVYVARWARGSFAETVNALTRKYHWLKGTLAGAWQLLGTWSAMEP